MEAGKLIVSIVADTSQLQGDLQEAQGDVQAASKKMATAIEIFDKAEIGRAHV